MASRQEIINNLYTDLSTMIDNNSFTGRVYDSRIGIFDPNEFSALPALGVWIIDDVVEDDLMSDDVFRRLNLIIYGYVNAESMDTYQNFYTLIDDVEKFLYSTNSRYYQNTYLGNVDITYGGSTEQTAMFVLNFSILYSQTGLES